MADVPVACRIYTRFLVEDWLRNVKDSDVGVAGDDDVSPAR